MHTAARQSGFTLLEVVAVLVIVGILAALAVPKFADFSEAARNSKLQNIGASFKAGADQVHAYWLAKGSPGPQLNMIKLPPSQAGGDLSVNAFGWPADTRGVSRTLNSTNDCIDVWRAVLAPGAPSVSNGTSTDFRAQYLGGNSCRYIFQQAPTKSLVFNSNTGALVVNL
ncbi:type II secretion system protein [Simiduia sp. 21SJ11W-1]|uniref:type II secretion system protein n=1 Tax=Simiduia sp. 21SJ11W-1 TaxID=2909669 RepID=UPI00273A73FD|nr:type II secretion system protein [Simiduia sp. 21SJ11W-1]